MLGAFHENSLHWFTHSPFHSRTLVYIFLSIDHGKEYTTFSFCLSLIFSQTKSSIQTSFIGTKSFSNTDSSKKCSTLFPKGHKALSGARSADRATVKVGLGRKPAKCALPTSYDRRGETQADFLLAFSLSFLHDCFLSGLMLILFEIWQSESFTCPVGCTVVVATNPETSPGHPGVQVIRFPNPKTAGKPCEDPV